MFVFLIGSCAAILVLLSQPAMDAALSAAGLFVSGVLPALFPMMVLSRLLPADSPAWLSAAFCFLSGSPASVQRMAQMKNQREKYYALTGVMSPMFFTGTLARWTHNPFAAWKLLLLHWLSAAVTAALWKENPIPPDEIRQTEWITLPAAVSQSAVSMLGVCGAMMLFSIAAGVLRAFLCFAFPLWTAEKFLSILHALLETGSGAHAVIQAWEEPPFALLGALCSFGGMSIWLQNLLFLPKSIRPAKLIGMRMLHGAVCYGLCLISFP